MFEFEEHVVESSSGDKYLEVILSGAVSIENIGCLKGMLLERFETNDHIILDMGQITVVDFALFQLLCATNKYTQQNGKFFELKNQCTEAFIDRAQSLGFLREQGCTESEDPAKCLWISQNM